MKVFALIFVLFLPPYVSGDSVIIVNKSSHELVLYQHGIQQFSAPAAVGKTEDLTPEGRFQVLVKAKDPYYRKKDIPGGDSRNPLGSRWIGFDARGTDGRVYGIHGTNQPESIGKSVSAGCIRLKNEDVQALFDLIPMGADVFIVNDSSTMEETYEKWEKQRLHKFLNSAP
ncbi:L,D-transpeptidase [Halobacillus yeomjeoni]|nr:L,D-transpeptidase [Halobacillus yeomjeoni]MCA0982822.1 L,D-transpeptidase [Halobacillus yeomjeoni]